MKDHTPLGGGVELLQFVIPIPRNPALLGQETTYTWRTADGGYSKQSAHSSGSDTPREKEYKREDISNLTKAKSKGGGGVSAS